MIEVVGDRAVIADPGYNLSHLLFYELLVGDHRDKEIGIYKEDDIHTSSWLEDIVVYLEDDEPIWIRYQRRFVSPGRDIILVGSEKADQLRQLGLHAQGLANEIYRITGTEPSSPAEVDE